MYKQNKGITLILLALTIVLMLIISSTLIYNIKYNQENNDLRAIKTDITILQNKVSTYFVSNKAIPIIDKYTSPLMEDKNIYDDDNYYVIDLEALEGVTLTKGQGYKGIKNGTTSVEDVTDVYIINQKTHTIYYAAGVTVKGIIYHTLEENYSRIGINKY